MGVIPGVAGDLVPFIAAAADERRRFLRHLPDPEPCPAHGEIRLHAQQPVDTGAEIVLPDRALADPLIAVFAAQPGIAVHIDADNDGAPVPGGPHWARGGRLNLHESSLHQAIAGIIAPCAAKRSSTSDQI